MILVWNDFLAQYCSTKVVLINNHFLHRSSHPLIVRPINIPQVLTNFNLNLTASLRDNNFYILASSIVISEKWILRPIVNWISSDYTNISTNKIFTWIWLTHSCVTCLVDVFSRHHFERPEAPSKRDKNNPASDKTLNSNSRAINSRISFLNAKALMIELEILFRWKRF